MENTQNQNTQGSPQNPQPKVKINWTYECQQYGNALLVSIILFAFYSIYLLYRRGYYDLYIVNKVFANVSIVLLGFVLLLGPLSRMFNKFDKYVQYRKELGITAFFLAIIHGIVSFFFLSDHFTRERFFTTGKWPFIFGLIASSILIVIFFISNKKASAAIGSKVWWKMQNWGVRLVFIFVTLHVFIMKYSNWLSWYQKGGATDLKRPDWPGAGILTAWFIIFVIVVRTAEALNKKFGMIAWYFGIIALVIIYVLTFLWGRQFA